MKSLYLGSFIHSKSLDVLEYLHDAAVFVDEKGVIVAIERVCDLKKAEETIYPKLGWSSADVTIRSTKPGQFFFPGFIGQSSTLTSQTPTDRENRHPYPCLPIPQRRHLRQNHPPRLAEHLHLPHGK